MASDRELLQGLNKTEAIQMVRNAGLGNAGQDLKREEIIDLLVNSDEESCNDALEGWRYALESHIFKNRKRLMSQLPGCPGTCVNYGCPDLVVVRCWKGFSRDMV